MSNFKNFTALMEEKFQTLVKNHKNLYLTDVSKDDIWEMYLNSFPSGTNKMYKERREYDCNHCKQFLRPYGNIVAIENNKLISIWDIDAPGYYKEVADKLSSFVKSKAIKDIFVNDFAKLGIPHNTQMLPDGSTIKWNHFSFELPSTHVNKSSNSNESLKGSARDVKNVFKRALDEITVDAIETTLELIEQGSLYRGDEFKPVYKKFLEYKKLYINLPDNQKDNYCWIEAQNAGSIAKIRNQAPGTLLVDISSGKDLDHAVGAFEKVMAPTNYKRPNAIFTKKMIADAQNTIEEMGLVDSLPRRFAELEDITANNVLFANRDAKKAMNVFEELNNEVEQTPKNLSKIETIKIDDFIANVLPGSTSVEVLFENKHTNNLVSLIAPQIGDSKTLFKWDNNFSWAYTGGLTDSIKERVKKAGGRVDGDLRCSLSWFNTDDLDLHMVEPGGNHIYHGDKRSQTTKGELDVDMNVSAETRTPVENITYPNKDIMREGNYKLYVKNYTHREKIDVGFVVEMEFNGTIHTFNYNKEVSGKRNVTVVEFSYSKKDGVKITKSLPSEESSKEVWGINTNNYRKASIVLNSPNYWDNKTNGNKHYFFMLEGCKNPSTPNGFFNEYLKEELLENKRVFAALGSKMSVKESETQLSGLGFSSTKRAELVCKVEGKFTRVLKIKF